MRNDHYFESHVTIAPVFGEELERVKAIVSMHKFRVADLLMKRSREDTPERSKNDTFCTGRDVDYENLRLRTMATVLALQSASFDVWRYKIESTIIDSKYSDSLGLFDDLPSDRNTRERILALLDGMERDEND